MLTDPTVPQKQKTFRLRWAPTMQVIAVVQAASAKLAARKAPKPYRNFLGEIDVEEINPKGA